MSGVIVAIEDLCYSHGGKDILHDINLEVCRGDFISIIGPNGGGKTTLLKLILGLWQPTRGSIRIQGRPPRASNTSIGYVPQHVDHNLSFPATTLDVVLMGGRYPFRRFLPGSSREDRRRAQEIMEKVGIGDCVDAKIASLSGGQRQRVLIARALVSHPELLILDEPTSNIDTKGQTEFYELLKELNRELTILMVSHDLLIVSRYAKSIACLNKGLHYHRAFGSSGEVLEAFYSCSVEEICPVGMIPRVQQEILQHQEEQQ